MRMTEAIEEYANYRETGKARRKTIDDHRKNLMYFSLCYGNPDVEQVKHRDVINYLQSMNEHGWSANSRAHVASTFRRFFKFLRGLEFKVTSPDLIPLPEVDYGVPEAVTKEEYKAILDVLSYQKQNLQTLRNLLMVRMMWETGARKGELLSIRLKDIQWNGHPPSVLIKTEKAKEHTRRHLVWSETTHDILIEFASRMEMEGPLFPSLNRHRYMKALSPQGPAAILNDLTSKAGIERRIHPHMFRHAFGKRNAEKNKSPYTISTAMGHADPRSSYRYARLYGPEQKKLAFDMVDEV